MKSFLNLRASVAYLCLLTVAGNGAAQTEDDKSNLFTKAKAFLNRSVVHGVDTNYVKTPAQPWQVSVKSRGSDRLADALHHRRHRSVRRREGDALYGGSGRHGHRPPHHD